MEQFEKELAELINKHSIENGSNTPDFVLAAYLVRCLEALNSCIKSRDGFYGVETNKPTEIK